MTEYSRTTAQARVPETMVKHLLAALPTQFRSPGHTDRWLDWKRLRQAAHDLLQRLDRRRS